jgi:hypothetical protein
MREFKKLRSQLIPVEPTLIENQKSYVSLRKVIVENLVTGVINREVYIRCYINRIGGESWLPRKSPLIVFAAGTLGFSGLVTPFLSFHDAGFGS